MAVALEEIEPFSHYKTCSILLPTESDIDNIIH